jgi:hypothetical protein
MQQLVIETQQPERDYQMVKANDVIEAGWRLSTAATKILVTVLHKAAAKSGEEIISSRLVVIQGEEFRQLQKNVYSNSTQFHRNIEGWIAEMQNNPVTIKQPGGWTRLYWFEMVSFSRDKEKLEFLINPTMFASLIKLDRRFTTLDYEIAMRLGTGNSIRMYEIFSKSYFKAKPEYIMRISVEAMRLWFDLSEEGTYGRSNNIRGKILEPAIKDINASNCGFKLELVKTDGGGRAGVKGWDVKLTRAGTREQLPVVDEQHDMPKEITLGMIPSPEVWATILKGIGFRPDLVDTENSKAALSSWTEGGFNINNLISALTVIEQRGEMQKPVAYYTPVIREVIEKRVVVKKPEKKVDPELLALEDERRQVWETIQNLTKVAEAGGSMDAMATFIEQSRARFDDLTARMKALTKQKQGGVESEVAESPAQKLLSLVKF